MWFNKWDTEIPKRRLKTQVVKRFRKFDLIHLTKYQSVIIFVCSQQFYFVPKFWFSKIWSCSCLVSQFPLLYLSEYITINTFMVLIQSCLHCKRRLSELDALFSSDLQNSDSFTFRLLTSNVYLSEHSQQRNIYCHLITICLRAWGYCGP